MPNISIEDGSLQIEARDREKERRRDKDRRLLLSNTTETARAREINNTLEPVSIIYARPLEDKMYIRCSDNNSNLSIHRQP